MKSLSVRQPWAWLIVRPDLTGQARLDAIAHGEIKDIENRTWSTNHRGQTLIHAAKGMTRAEYESAMIYAINRAGFRGRFPEFEELQRGGIVGIAELVDVVPAHLRDSQWHMAGCYGFRMADSKPLPFTPCKGSLGFFNPPPEVLAGIAQKQIGGGGFQCVK